MSETPDGRRSPFDLFGPPARRAADTEGPSVDLSELMREEAGRSPADQVEPPESPPSAPFAEDPDEDLPAELRPAPFDEPARPEASPRVDEAPEAADPTAAPRESAAAESAVPVQETSTPDRVPPGPVADPDAAGPVRPPLPVDTRQLWLLRLLLVGNLAMMLVMLALPHPLEPRADGSSGLAPTTSDSPGTAAEPRVPADPFVLPGRDRSLGLPDDAVYERALLLALEGNFDGACVQLERLLASNPDMNPAVARLVHAHLAYYLRKAGRLTEAIEHERLGRQEADRSSLPEELLEAARAAEARGDGEAMRRAYARFLLQEGQLPPDMRAMVLEVLTKLGDSYRVQADAGEDRSEERSR